MSELIATNLNQDMMVKPEGRKQEVTEDNTEIEIKIDRRTSTEIILELFAENSRRKSGWHRRDLHLNSRLEEKRESIPQLNKEEKTQLLAEYEMIRTYQALTGNQKHNKKNKRSCKFVKKSKKDNHHTLTYLTEKAWGLKSGRKFLSRLKKEVVSDAVGRGVDMKTAQVTFSFGDQKEENEVTTVIDNLELATKCFTAKYLFTINKLRQQAADLETIDRATYQARLIGAR